MHKTKGFTLIELLVVIAIVALLISILVPLLTRAREHVKIAICRKNVKTLAVAWLTYIDDNDGLLVSADVGKYKEDEWAHSTTSTSPEETIKAITTGKLFPYIKIAGSYHCPSDNRYKRPNGNLPGDGEYRSYSIVRGMNGWDEEPNETLKRYNEIKRPADLYVFIEERYKRPPSQGAWHIETENKWSSNLALWHNNRTILGFADSHVELHKWEDKRTIAYHKSPTPTDADSLQVNNTDLKYMWEHYPRHAQED